MDHEPIRFGTSNLTARGWEGTFYPADVKPSQYLAYYSQHFDSLEVGSTLTVDRTRELQEWVEIFTKIADRKIAIFAYVDNHDAGHAPATAATFRKMWLRARRQKTA
jgi:uncharacterized protein YecE (DUF72 family)